MRKDIDNLFEKQLEKQSKVNTAFNSMLKRKNILQSKIFKKRYERVNKHISGNVGKSANPFKCNPKSVFSEYINDPKMDIP